MVGKQQMFPSSGRLLVGTTVRKKHISASQIVKSMSKVAHVVYTSSAKPTFSREHTLTTSKWLVAKKA